MGCPPHLLGRTLATELPSVSCTNAGLCSQPPRYGFKAELFRMGRGEEGRGSGGVVILIYVKLPQDSQDRGPLRHRLFLILGHELPMRLQVTVVQLPLHQPWPGLLPLPWCVFLLGLSSALCWIDGVLALQSGLSAIPST